MGKNQRPANDLLDSSYLQGSLDAIQMHGYDATKEKKAALASGRESKNGNILQRAKIEYLVEAIYTQALNTILMDYRSASRERIHASRASKATFKY